MQTPAGLDAAAYHAALLSHREVRTTVRILTLDRETVSEVDAFEPDGQLNLMSPYSAVSRTAQLTVLDPHGDLFLDSATLATRMLRVVQTLHSPLLASTAPMTCFTGPLETFRRDGATVAVSGQGREQRARTDVAALKCPRGMFVVDAIERIARHYGETWFSFPKGERARLAKPVFVGREEKRWPWVVMLKLARSIGMQLFYDGRSCLVLRDIPDVPVFDFAAPLSEVRREFDWSTVYNRVQVKGKKKVRAVAVAPRWHDFSPQTLAVNGKPWTRTFFYSDDKISSGRQARQVAARELGRVLRQDEKVDFTHVPVWHLDPLDPGTVVGGPVEVREASIPFGVGDMTVGDLRRVRGRQAA